MSSQGDQGRYEGMTVNERLFNAGILAQFDEAARRRDRARLVELLRQVELSQSEAEWSVDTLLAEPAKEGRKGVRNR
jgi:hypothetical protein